jgi:hypothetical protein
VIHAFGDSTFGDHALAARLLAKVKPIILPDYEYRIRVDLRYRQYGNFVCWGWATFGHRPSRTYETSGAYISEFHSHGLSSPVAVGWRFVKRRSFPL